MPKLEVRAERPRMDLPKVWSRTPQYLQCPLSLSHISTTKDTQWHFLSSIIRATFYSPLPPPDRLEVAVELLSAPAKLSRSLKLSKGSQDDYRSHSDDGG